MTQKAIHIHEAYNSSLRNHEVIHEKENLSDIEKTLHMSKESILVEDFNLHHFIWEESFYSRQHLLLNKLIEMITNIDASLALSWDTITRNYQKSQTTIDLIFTTESITNRLIRCKINEEMKNFSDHLSIQTVIDFRVCKESARKCYECIKTKALINSQWTLAKFTAYWLELVNDLVEIWLRFDSDMTQLLFFFLNTLFFHQHLVYLHHILFMSQTHFFRA